jgi:hypothetical protein
MRHRLSGFISSLSEIFPIAPGRHVFGPKVTIGWGTPTLVTATIGLLIEVPDPIKIALLGKVDVFLPNPRNGLGNLIHRTSALTARLSAGRVPAPGGESSESARLRALAEALPGRVDAAVAGFLFDDAVAAILEVDDAANRGLEVAAPWRTARTDPVAAAAALYAPLEAARIAAGELSPFVPELARTIAGRLGDADLRPGWGGLASGAALRIGPPPLPRKIRRPAHTTGDVA